MDIRWNEIHKTVELDFYVNCDHHWDTETVGHLGEVEERYSPHFISVTHGGPTDIWQQE